MTTAPIENGSRDKAATPLGSTYCPGARTRSPLGRPQPAGLRELLLALCLTLPLWSAATDTGFEPLFPNEGVPEGWTVRAWNDIPNPANGNPEWKVENGVLHGGDPRGSWLLSQREYDDFILEFEFFQELSREEGNVQIRNARIQVLHTPDTP
jgi:hypothetical protein